MKARRKLKDSKALHNFPTFSGLNDEEVNLLIDQMDHITRFKNDAVCHQHDVSDSFYIIVKGSAVATVDAEALDTGNNEVKQDTDQEEEEGDTTKCRTIARTCPEQIEVGRLEVLDFFGEGSLVKDGDGDGDGDGMCSATVTVVSDRCELLRLKRKDFLTMNESSTTFQKQHEDSKSVLEQLKDVKMERTKNNQALLLERKRSSNKMGVLGSGEEKVGLKPVSLEAKGVPKLTMVKNGGGGERSLFS